MCKICLNALFLKKKKKQTKKLTCLCVWLLVAAAAAVGAAVGACRQRQEVIQVLSNQSGHIGARGALQFRQDDLDAAPGGGTS